MSRCIPVSYTHLDVYKRQDAAEALAIMVAGSNEEFAKLMNEKCKELGLKYTHFTNPTGLYDEEQYTTPSEMAMIMEYAMKDETLSLIHIL